MITRTGKRRQSNHTRKLEAAFLAPEEGLRVRIDGLALQASLGIYPDERQQRQTIVVDVSWSIPREMLLAGDDIENTVDYDAVACEIERVLADRHFNLLEVLVLSIEQALLAIFPIKDLHISVCKLAAIPAARGVSVSCN
jgi:dihydroneopterin aldolase